LNKVKLNSSCENTDSFSGETFTNKWYQEIKVSACFSICIRLHLLELKTQSKSSRYWSYETETLSKKSNPETRL